jgi:hypothetical protein
MYIIPIEKCAADECGEEIERPSVWFLDPIDAEEFAREWAQHCGKTPSILRFREIVPVIVKQPIPLWSHEADDYPSEITITQEMTRAEAERRWPHLKGKDAPKSPVLGYQEGPGDSL